MRVVNRLVHPAGKIYRRLFMPTIDTIPQISARHSDFAPVRAEILEAGTDSLQHFGNEYVAQGGLSLQQNPDEFAALCMFLDERDSHGTYVEIGSASGGACLFLYRRRHFSRVLSLDDANHPRAAEQPENFSHIPGIRQFVGDSHSQQALRFLNTELTAPIDIAFIDGDHSHEGVMKDISLLARFLGPGALMILHDTVAAPGVELAWIRQIRSARFKPLAEYVGRVKPLGIGIAEAT